MRIIKYLIMILILWNVPGYMLAYFGGTAGSLSSYASSLLLVLLYMVSKEKHKPLFPFILLGILYFTISGLNFSDGHATNLIKEFLRFMIIAVGLVEVLYRTTKKEIYIILLFGALSIVVNALVFPLANASFYPTYGRYSGFYLNPNFAGSICLVGYALSYSMSDKRLKLGGQMLFTLAGIFTLSRTFFLIWVIINLISVYQDRKNIKAPLIGFSLLLLVLTFSGKLSLHAERFSVLEDLFSDKKVQTKAIEKDTRTETWAYYYEMILEKPFFGNGYQKFQLKKSGLPGVHNSYLMVLGEAGIIPFLILVGIYIHLLLGSYKLFGKEPEFFYLSLVVSSALLVGHGYFSNFYNIFISMYVFIHLRRSSYRLMTNEKKPLNEIFLKN